MFRRIITQVNVKNKIRYFLDNFLPPVIRDSRLFFGLVAKIYNSKIDIDFKTKAFEMSDEEFQDAYERVSVSSVQINENFDPFQENFIFENLIGETILEVGAGNGALALKISQKKYKVMAVDLSTNNVNYINKRATNEKISLTASFGNIEQLPFADKSFDTVISLHTLEHVRQLTQAVSELKRVAKKRILIVVPRERYNRYSCNYHLNFFYGEEQLKYLFGLKKCKTVANSDVICYMADID